ncbi:MAG: hypothetical protein RBR22_13645 [Desulfuromonas sp.]|nr:hypothetical protein [Desulfuromonas sp.]
MAGIYTSIAIKNLAPHPAIGRILARALASYEPENQSPFNDEILLMMQKSVPVHVIKTGTDQLLFFAGWELLSEFRRRNITTAWAVIHEKEPDKIELWALQNELSKAAYIRGDTEKKQQYFYDLLNSNKTLWSKVFTVPRPRTAVSALQKLCNLTRGYARKFSKNNQQANSLARLLQDFKKKDPGND